MPLDPELAVVVEMANSLPPMDMRTADLAQLRATSRATAIGYGPVEEVAAVRDDVVPGPAGPIPVRIYTPTGDPSGLLVFFHGSGFVIYDLDSHDRECRALANRAGAVVVSVDYRLSPEHRFPAAADDCVAATRWAAAHAEQLGSPAGRLAVAGDSAGGTLAAVVAQVLRDEGGPPLALHVMVYPVTDLAAESASYAENGKGYLLSTEIMRFFIDSYVPDPADRLDPRASPLRATSFAGLAPALVITAEFDPLRDEGEAYADALRRAGVPVTCTRYDGAVHGFFQMSNFSALGRRALDEAGAAIAAALRA
jgi:acetyl esterase